MYMYEYTTPNLGIIFPSTVDSEDIINFYMTMTQNGAEKVHKAKAAFTQDTTNPNKFVYRFTEAETGSFIKDKPAYVQVRANIGGVSVASKTREINIKEVLHKGAIL